MSHYFKNHQVHFSQWPDWYCGGTKYRHISFQMFKITLALVKLAIFGISKQLDHWISAVAKTGELLVANIHQEKKKVWKQQSGESGRFIIRASGDIIYQVTGLFSKLDSTKELSLFSAGWKIKTVSMHVGFQKPIIWGFFYGRGLSELHTSNDITLGECHQNQLWHPCKLWNWFCFKRNNLLSVSRGTVWPYAKKSLWYTKEIETVEEWKIEPYP